MRMKGLRFGVQEGRRWVWGVSSFLEELLTLSEMAWCELRRIQVPAQDRQHDGTLK